LPSYSCDCKIGYSPLKGLIKPVKPLEILYGVIFVFEKSFTAIILKTILPISSVEWIPQYSSTVPGHRAVYLQGILAYAFG